MDLYGSDGSERICKTNLNWQKAMSLGASFPLVFIFNSPDALFILELGKTDGALLYVRRLCPGLLRGPENGIRRGTATPDTIRRRRHGEKWDN